MDTIGITNRPHLHIIRKDVLPKLLFAFKPSVPQRWIGVEARFNLILIVRKLLLVEHIDFTFHGIVYPKPTETGPCVFAPADVVMSIARRSPAANATDADPLATFVPEVT